MQSAIELTRELVRFDTVNPPGAERPAAERLAGLLERAGFAVELIPYGEGRAHNRAHRRTPDKPPLGFTGHLDTVPLGARPWSVDPFAGEIADGKLYGRGSSDMKGGVAAFVAACLALADRLAATPGCCWSSRRARRRAAPAPRPWSKPEGRLGQAGALVVAEPTGNRLLVGHKGALWLEAETTGMTAHGSMPEKGVNAVYKAARAVAALQAFDFDVARHEVLGAPTLNVGTIQGGLNINSVPDRALIGIDIRTIPAQDHAQIRERLAGYLDRR